MEDTFSIINKTKMAISELPFSDIKTDILGKKYSLSMAFVGEAESKKINNKYRAKNNPTNILSFLLTKNTGEIILCPTLIKKESKNKDKNFGKNFEQLLGFLVIHGMLHLKGFEHSSRMEIEEKKYDQKYFCGDRRRIVHDTSRGRRILKGRKKS